MNLSGSGASAKPGKPIEDKDYVKWIEKIPSVIDGAMDVQCRGDAAVYLNDGHHIHTKGSGGGDYWRIPITRRQHQLCHSKGNKYVESLHLIDFHEIVCKLLRSRFGYEIPAGDFELAARAMVKKAEENYGK